MKRSRLLVVAGVAMTVTAVEMVWTRIFSAEFFYTFAFLILSIAIMGLGLGGLSLRLIPGLNRKATTGAALDANRGVRHRVTHTHVPARRRLLHAVRQLGHDGAFRGGAGPARVDVSLCRYRAGVRLQIPPHRDAVAVHGRPARRGVRGSGRGRGHERS